MSDEPRDSGIAPRPARLLLVEDHRPLAEQVAELLTEGLPDVTVRCCGTAEEALAAAADEGFDVAIVDVRLPGADGMGLVPALKERAPHGEVLLVTGHASIESAMAAVRHGAFAYVLKPFDPEELLGLVERALQQVRLRAEREALQRALSASEALHRAVVDTVEALILGLEEEGGICLANRFALEVLGQPLQRLRGRPLWELGLEREDRDSLRHLLEGAAAGAGRERTARIDSPRGPRVVRWTVAPLRPPTEGQVAWVAVGLDVTERLEMERRSAANEALATLGRLTAGLAHEIRNPLNAAMLQLELLGRSAARLPEASGIASRAAIVREEVQRLSRLLQDFLSLARPSELRTEPVSLQAVIREVEQLERPLAEQGGVRLRSELPEEELRVRGDPARLKQVLVNLVGNALEALSERGEGRIVVRARRAPDADEVLLEVEDDGPGIAPQVAERLFEPFVTTKEGGTGLGLALVRQVVERHGGQVTLRPRPQGGTIATVRLPAAD